jgi:hypothetical protein
MMTNVMCKNEKIRKNKKVETVKTVTKTMNYNINISK